MLSTWYFETRQGLHQCCIDNITCFYSDIYFSFLPGTLTSLATHQLSFIIEKCNDYFQKLYLEKFNN